MEGIFISYRHRYTAWQAGRLFESLNSRFPGKIFMDTEVIWGSMDFRTAIDTNVTKCDALVALIDKRWLKSVQENATAERDYMRLEIASALANGKCVIPVRIDGAKLPRSEFLPDDIKDLVYLPGVSLRHESWNRDVEWLVEELRRKVQLPPLVVRVYRNQGSAFPVVEDFIDAYSPKTADLLEYSTLTIYDLLYKLKDTGTKIRLLMCHPDSALDEVQKKAIDFQTYILAHKAFPGYLSDTANIEIRLYRTRASLRGRKLGRDLLCVSWYTYRGHELQGHDNAMILANINSPQGKCLENMFDLTFDSLWNAPDTVQLRDLLTEEVNVKLRETVLAGLDEAGGNGAVQPANGA